MKKPFSIAIALGVALIIASCEGTGKQKEVEKTAENIAVEAVADSSRQGADGASAAQKAAFPAEEGKAWLFRHVSETLKKNVDKSNQSRTVKRMDVNFSKESAGTGVYLVSGNMQNGTEFSYEFRLTQEGAAFNIASSDAPKYFFENK